MLSSKSVPGFLRRSRPRRGLTTSASACRPTGPGTPIATWRAYMRYHTAIGVMPWLGQAAFDESFSFNSKLTGQRAPLPRWKRAFWNCWTRSS